MAYTKYKVQPGDTIWGISRKYKCSQAQLCRINKIITPDYIQVGQILKIPDAKQISRWDKAQAVLEFIGVLITGVLLIAAIVLGFKFIGGMIIYIIEYKPPVCHYEYVDYNGNAGIAQECLSRFETLYCGNSSEAFKVNSVKKVCVNDNKKSKV